MSATAKPAWVYMARVSMRKEQSHIKFGRSYDPFGRVQTLQTGSPWGITLIGAYKCKSIMHSIHVEKMIHLELGPWRLKSGGKEWFARRGVAIVLHSLAGDGVPENIKQDARRKYPTFAEFLDFAQRYDVRPINDTTAPMHRWRA